jgi:hypothetical protein
VKGFLNRSKIAIVPFGEFLTEWGKFASLLDVVRPGDVRAFLFDKDEEFGNAAATLQVQN